MDTSLKYWYVAYSEYGSIKHALINQDPIDWLIWKNKTIFTIEKLILINAFEVTREQYLLLEAVL